MDREAGDAYIERFPGIIPLAKESRRFLIRVVHYLAAEAGVRQFLDIGTDCQPWKHPPGRPAGRPGCPHRLCGQRPDGAVAYASAPLTETTDEGVTGYIDADIHDPDQIVADARNILNFTKPIAVMFMGVLGHVADYHEMVSIVAGWWPPSLPAVIWCCGTAPTPAKASARPRRTTTTPVPSPYITRRPEQISRCFEGLEMLEPDLVSLSLWRPDPVDAGAVKPVDGYGAVTRKP